MSFSHSPGFRGGNRRRFGLSLLLGVSALACFGLAPANATTLARKSLSDLVKGSELIFEGQAVGSAVEALPIGQGARTCVNFKIAEIVAGAHPGSTIRLCFFGCMVGGQGFGVSGMNYPAVGEHGIYLVESTSQQQVNPLIGWDQGRFLVVKDAATGTLRMTTADHRRIVGLAPEAAIPTPAEGGIVSPDATADGVVSDDQPTFAGAMSRDDFVKELRSLHDR
jgi:hypothetical protein